jgi:hypothetical protein
VQLVRLALENLLGDTRREEAFTAEIGALLDRLPGDRLPGAPGAQEA